MRPGGLQSAGVVSRVAEMAATLELPMGKAGVLAVLPAGGAGFSDGGSGGSVGCSGCGGRLCSSARRRCRSARVGTYGPVMPLLVFRSMIRHSYCSATRCAWKPRQPAALAFDRIVLVTVMTPE